MAKPSSTRVHIESYPDGTAFVSIDGRDISNKIANLHVDLSAIAPVKLTVEYACYDQYTIDGEMEVVHVCPKRARSGPDWSTTA